MGQNLVENLLGYPIGVLAEVPPSKAFWFKECVARHFKWKQYADCNERSTTRIGENGSNSDINPPSPANFGEFLHSLVDDFGKGLFEMHDFQEVWKDKGGNVFCHRVVDYSLKKVRLQELLALLPKKFDSEKWLYRSYRDCKFKGSIDIIHKDQIWDLKTGAICNDGSIKPEYVCQMYVYAWLYENYSIPEKQAINELYLISLKGKKYSIEFDPQCCQNLIEVICNNNQLAKSMLSDNSFAKLESIEKPPCKDCDNEVYCPWFKKYNENLHRIEGEIIKSSKSEFYLKSGEIIRGEIPISGKTGCIMRFHNVTKSAIEDELYFFKQYSKVILLTID
jgi:hypothetical protein